MRQAELQVKVKYEEQGNKKRKAESTPVAAAAAAAAVDDETSTPTKRKVAYIYELGEENRHTCAYVIDMEKLDLIGGTDEVQKQLSTPKRRQMYIAGKKCTDQEFKNYKGGDWGDVFDGFIAVHMKRHIQDDMQCKGFKPAEDEEIVWVAPYFPQC
jgi:hypothetical protein